MSDQLPPGVRRRDPGAEKHRFGSKGPKSTVMGTVLFVAEMQRRVPLKAKLVAFVILLLLAGAGAGGWWMLTARAREQEAIAEILALPYSEGIGRARKLADEASSDDVRVQAFAYLGDAADTEAVPVLARGLAASASPTRRAAAEALARIGPPALSGARQALVTALARAEPADAPQVAYTLTLLADPRGIDAAVNHFAAGRLQRLAVYDARRFADSVGREKLVELTRHGDPAVRQLAATSLGRMCTPAAVPALTGLTTDRTQAIAVAAAASLGECDTPEAGDALVRVVASREDLRGAIVRAIIDDVGAPGLLALLRRETDPARRLTLVGHLRDLRDPRAADGLAAELTNATPPPEGAVRLEIGRALAALGDPRAVPPLLAEIAGRDVMAARSAALALVELGTPEPTAASSLLDAYHRRQEVRPSLLLALASTGVCPAREMEEATRDAWTLAAAVEALNRCRLPRGLTLARELVASGSPLDENQNARIAALRALATREDTSSVATILAVVTAAEVDARVRTAAADALGAIADDSTLERATDTALDPNTARPVRAALLRALFHRAPPSSIGRLVGHLRAGGTSERTTLAALAVGYAADPSLEGELTRLLEDERARIAAAIAVVMGGDAAGAARFVELSRTERSLDDTVRAAYSTHSPVADRRDLENGRLLRRLRQLHRIRTLGQGEYWERHVRGLRTADGITVAELRRALSAVLTGTQPEPRDIAAAALRELGERGTLLATRARGGPGAVEADRALRYEPGTTPAAATPEAPPAR